MRHWNLSEIDTPNGTRSPVVLHSQEGGARIVLIQLDAGEELGEHQVREATVLLIAEGGVVIEGGDESIEAGAGELFQFEPDEQRAVRSTGGARILLVLAPWPGEGHYRGDWATDAGVSAS